MTIYILNISSTVKKMLVNEIRGLSLKTNINELYLKKQLLFNGTSEKKIYNCLQLN